MTDGTYNTLVSLLKKQMGYTEQRRTCADCVHSREEDNVLRCALNPAATFEVWGSSQCNFFKSALRPEL